MRITILLFLTALLVSACIGKQVDPRNEREIQEEQAPTVFSEGGIFQGAGISVGGQTVAPGQEGGGIGVNAYLWHAALDTIDFLPLHQVDPFGGVILTDWHSPPNSPQERIKLTVFIAGRALRSDAVKVALFREVLQNGNWVSADSSPVTERRIENAILERARERRLQALSNQ